jgi:hypothetical protein
LKPRRTLVWALGAWFAASAVAQVGPTDAPDPAFQRPATSDAPASYADALRQWQSAADINAWLGARFVYDRARALALSETARAAGPSPAVLEPEAFYAQTRGVCIDMARFAVTALRRLDPQAGAAYLMIEFAPVQVAGQVLRRHWLATYQHDGRHYFFADSKRPGHMAGPYESVAAFVADYGAYRGRAIVAYKVVHDHRKQVQQRARAVPRTEPGL